MSEIPEPSVVAREAKSVHQSLKELLKTKEPFDREVDFQRKNLRRRYLILLLVYPNAKESKDVENHLWMQTSYASIASFKQRIAQDRTAQNNQRPQQQASGPTKQNPHHGVVEHRKLLQRFKQFLADEERFWKQLILRLFRLSNLQEAREALIFLGLLDEANEGTTSTSAEDTDESGRNHFQFPPKDTSLALLPKTTEEREARASTLSKALICLGDIARYREQYNESNGRPRAGQDDNIPARRGRRRGGVPEPVARPRNYDKAQQCYEQARLLVPHEGNASHQLAILASYQRDSFSSIIHYYRSLCVRQPYDTASENLGTVLMKSLDLWRQKTSKEKDKLETHNVELPTKVRVDLLRERIVVLHALWRVGMEKGIEKMQSISPKHNEKVAQDFYFLVSNRDLSIDMILNSLVIAQGALWKHRMIRDPIQSRRDSTPESPHLSAVIEWSILGHILDLHRILLDIGKKEIIDAPDEADLALKITATFRRTLPALRIASKWLRANLKYLGQDQEFAAIQAMGTSDNAIVTKRDMNKLSQESDKTIKFWKSYSSFVLALSQAFPPESLPLFEGPLEEDIEMRGFLPLRHLIGEGRKTGDKTPSNGSAREQVHPNVEQLMRISDLLEDAKTLLEVENPPLSLVNNHFMFNLEIVEAQHPEPSDVGSMQTKTHHESEDIADFANRMEDDPVREAFQFLNSASDTAEDEEDEIVYMRSPTLSPKTFPTPISPIRLSKSPERVSPRASTLHHGNTPVKLPAAVPQSNPTTAQDLLNNFMGPNPNRLSNIQPTRASQPEFLFGLDPGASIWSASRDEQPLIYSGNGNSPSVAFNGHPAGANGVHVGNSKPSNGLHPAPNVHPTGQIHPSSSHSLPASDPHDLLVQSHQSIWSPSYSVPTTSQRHPVPFSTGLSQATTLIPQPLLHKREQSISGSSYSNHLYPNYMQQDPFAYSLQHAAIHQPDPRSSAHLSTFIGHGGPQLSTSGILTSDVMAHSVYNTGGIGYHSGQSPNQNIRPEMRQFLPPSVPQSWDNGG